MDVVAIQWCSICNSAESDGILTVEDPMMDDLIDLPACQKCVDGIYQPDQLSLEF